YGAAPISEALVERALAVLPGVDFVQASGMPGLSPAAPVTPPWAQTPEGRKRGKLLAAGRATFITQVKIVDEQGNEVPRGTVGEAVGGGPTGMQGHWT